MNTHELPTIDLSQLLSVMRANRLFIFSSLIIALILATIYLNVRELAYRARALIMPPDEKDLMPLILAQIPLNRAHSPEIYDLLEIAEVYKKFKMNLASRVHQRDFLLKHASTLGIGEDDLEYDVTSADGFGKRQSNGSFVELSSRWRLRTNSTVFFPSISIGDPALSFSVNSDKASSRPYLIFELTCRDASNCSELANLYLDFIDESVSQEVANLLRAGLDIRIQNISDMIAYQTELADIVRKRKILELEIAFSTAKALNIKQPSPSYGNYNSITLVPADRYFIDPGLVEITTPPRPSQRHLPLYHPGNIPRSINIDERISSGPPAYARGSDALNYELKNLKSPSAVASFFVPELLDLEQQRDWLQSIEINTDKLDVANIASPAITSSRPINLTAFQVISLFLGIGFGLAVFSVLIRWSFSQSRSQD